MGLQREPYSINYTIVGRIRNNNAELVDHDLQTMRLIAVKTLKLFIKTHNTIYTIGTAKSPSFFPFHLPISSLRNRKHATRLCIRKCCKKYTSLLFPYINYICISFFIGNTTFHLSLELLKKIWKTSLKVA